MATNLIDFLRELLFNQDVRQDFADHPAETLADHGLSHLSAEDVRDALVLMRDEPSQRGDVSREYNAGGNSVVAATPAPHHDGGHTESAAEYLNRYVQNYHVTDGHTATDHSVHQNIDNSDLDRYDRDVDRQDRHDDHDRREVDHRDDHGHHGHDGGHFNQDIDVTETTASGDGAVAAGHNVTGIITPGDHNQVGTGNLAGNGNVTGSNNNAATGHDNTTSFGTGDASHTDVGGNLTVGSGGAFSSHGNATSTHTDNSVNHSFNDQSQHSVSHSGNQDFDLSDHSDHSVADSYNTQTDDSTHSHNETHDSGNVDFHHV